MEKAPSSWWLLQFHILEKVFPDVGGEGLGEVFDEISLGDARIGMAHYDPGWHARLVLLCADAHTSGGVAADTIRRMGFSSVKRIAEQELSRVDSCSQRLVLEHGFLPTATDGWATLPFPFFIAACLAILSGPLSDDDTWLSIVRLPRGSPFSNRFSPIFWNKPEQNKDQIRQLLLPVRQNYAEYMNKRFSVEANE
ncbi:unnamed protein product [Amoebophrya sp. A25]|nr:unnamed protein product [Amoebophrya sp. A25]|eukprot:GSA25T00022337001.1